VAVDKVKAGTLERLLEEIELKLNRGYWNIAEQTAKDKASGVIAKRYFDDVSHT
jgi:hypothetical protein